MRAPGLQRSGCGHRLGWDGADCWICRPSGARVRLECKPTAHAVGYRLSVLRTFCPPLGVRVLYPMPELCGRRRKNRKAAKPRRGKAKCALSPLRLSASARESVSASDGGSNGVLAQRRGGAEKPVSHLHSVCELWFLLARILTPPTWLHGKGINLSRGWIRRSPSRRGSPTCPVRETRGLRRGWRRPGRQGWRRRWTGRRTRRRHPLSPRR